MQDALGDHSPSGMEGPGVSVSSDAGSRFVCSVDRLPVSGAGDRRTGCRGRGRNKKSGGKEKESYGDESGNARCRGGAADQAEELNHILHTYGSYIIGRMGIPYEKRGISLISIALDAPQDVISALAGKIGRLPGVTAKAVYSKVEGKKET